MHLSSTYDSKASQTSQFFVVCFYIFALTSCLIEWLQQKFREIQKAKNFRAIRIRKSIHHGAHLSDRNNLVSSSFQ